MPSVFRCGAFRPANRDLIQEDESLAAQHRRHVRVSATLCCRTEIVLSGDILGADGQVPQGAAAQGELALLTTS